MNKDVKKIYFADVRKEILKSIESPDRETFIGETVILVDGFALSVYQKKLTLSITLDGYGIPMIMCVGKKSGRIYYFALKALINIDF